MRGLPKCIFNLNSGFNVQGSYFNDVFIGKSVQTSIKVYWCPFLYIAGGDEASDRPLLRLRFKAAVVYLKRDLDGWIGIRNVSSGGL